MFQSTTHFMKEHVIPDGRKRVNWYKYRGMIYVNGRRQRSESLVVKGNYMRTYTLAPRTLASRATAILSTFCRSSRTELLLCVGEPMSLSKCPVQSKTPLSARLQHCSQPEWSLTLDIFTTASSAQHIRLPNSERLGLVQERGAVERL